MKKVLVSLGLAVGVLALAPSADAAGSVTGVGWWTRSPIASAPDGGVTVGNAPDGPLSVAAVEIDLGKDGMTTATLNLEQTGGQPPAAGQLVACVIGGFEPTEAGAIAEAPATTCDATQTSVTGNGTKWTLNLSDLVADRKGTVGIALVPASGSTAVWELQFDKPAFTGTAARPTTSGSTQSRPTTATTTAPSTASRPATTFAVQTPPAVAAPRPTTTIAASTPTTIPLGTTDAVPNATASAETFSGSTGESSSSEGRPVGQAITLAIIAAVVGIGAGVAHKVATARLSV
jgi:hypothetical protein